MTVAILGHQNLLDLFSMDFRIMRILFTQVEAHSQDYIGYLIGRYSPILGGVFFDSLGVAREEVEGPIELRVDSFRMLFFGFVISRHHGDF